MEKIIENHFGKFRLDGMIAEVSNYSKSFGSLKKAVHNYRSLRGFGGSMSRIAVGATAGAVASAFICPDGVMPYVLSAGVSLLYATIPAFIYRKRCVEKPNLKNIYEILSFMKMDLEATDSLVKESLKNLDTIYKSSDRDKVDKMVSEVECMYGIIRDTLDNFESKIIGIRDLSPYHAKPEDRKIVAGFVETATAWADRLYDMTMDLRYAGGVTRGKLDYEPDNQRGNALLMVLSGGLPFEDNQTKSTNAQPFNDVNMTRYNKNNYYDR